MPLTPHPTYHVHADGWIRSAETKPPLKMRVVGSNYHECVYTWWDGTLWHSHDVRFTIEQWPCWRFGPALPVLNPAEPLEEEIDNVEP